MKKKLIILNAPKGCGKDAAASHLCNLFNYNHVEFKSPVKCLVKSFYNLDEDKHTYFYERDNKEKPQLELGGLSIRECYIHVSETVIKPVFGRDVFGTLLAKSLSGVSVSSDGGFVAEVEAVAREIGKENVLIVQIHSEGKDFSGDSRQYLDVQGVTTTVVHNHFTPQFFSDIVDVVNNWIREDEE